MAALEQHWTLPLCEAVARVGGFGISDSLISPLNPSRMGRLPACRFAGQPLMRDIRSRDREEMRRVRR